MKFFNLKQFRKERNLTQREFSLALGISQSVASYIENGSMEISEYQLKRISKLYQVDDISLYVFERDTYISPEKNIARASKDKSKIMSGDWNATIPLCYLGKHASICKQSNVHVSIEGTMILDPNNGLGFGQPPYIIEPYKLTNNDLLLHLSKEDWFDVEMFDAFKRMYVIACALANVEPVKQIHLK